MKKTFRILMASLFLGSLGLFWISPNSNSGQKIKNAEQLNSFLKAQLREKKESLADGKKESYENFFDQWNAILEQEKDAKKVLRELSKRSAERNLMFTENTLENDTFRVELNGNFSDILDWLSSVEKEFFLIRIQSTQWEILPNGDIQTLLEFKHLNLGENKC